MRVLILPVLPLALAGCTTIASTAVDIVTLPVKVVSKGVDVATTSQSEADEKRGREIRKAEEKAGKEAREREKACRKAAALGEPCAVEQPPQ
jgi:predicted nuclease with RNAse H fold